jgi:uncharacterized protein (DUF111 family)
MKVSELPIEIREKIENEKYVEIVIELREVERKALANTAVEIGGTISDVIRGYLMYTLTREDHMDIFPEILAVINTVKLARKLTKDQESNQEKPRSFSS